MAQRHSTRSPKISANGKLALVPHPPGLLEREGLGRNQAEKPESSTSCLECDNEDAPGE